MVKEYEAMQEDNTSSVLEELEESKNRTKALEEILDDVECEGGYFALTNPISERTTAGSRKSTKS